MNAHTMWAGFPETESWPLSDCKSKSVLKFPWMTGNECQHSCISEGEEAIPGSYYSSQLRDGQDQQKVCHCYHSTSLYYSLSCCSPQPCFAHSIRLVFTATPLGISWLLRSPTAGAPPYVYAILQSPAKDFPWVSWSLCSLEHPCPHCRALVDHWALLDSSGRWLPLTQAQAP